MPEPTAIISAKPLHSLRHRLLKLALVPLLVIFPAILLVLQLVGGSRFDALVESMAYQRLASAHHSLDQQRREMESFLRWQVTTGPLQHQLTTSGADKELDQTLSSLADGLRLDILIICDQQGRLIASNNGLAPGSRLPTGYIQQQAASGSLTSGFESLSSEHLAAIAPQLVQQTRTGEQETKALLLAAAAHFPLSIDYPDSVLYGGVLLNRNQALIDRLRDVMFPLNDDPERVHGIATIYSGKLPVALAVDPAADPEELAGRMAPDVTAEATAAVLDQGRNLAQKEQRHGAWFISAYEPLDTNSGERIGMLATSFSLASYRAEKWLILGGIAALLALSMLGVTLVFQRGTLGIVRRLGVTMATMTTVRSGDHDVRVVPGPFNDEIDVLGEHFNTLLDTLQHREAAEERARLSLADEAARRRALFAHVRDGLAVLNADGSIDEANPSFLAMIGYRQEEIGRLRITDWDSRFLGEEGYTLAELLNQNDGSYETLHQRQDGSRYHAEVSVSPLEWEERILYLMLVRDVSERKRIEVEMVRLTRAIEQLTEQVFITDPDGVIEYVNPAFEKLSGFSRGEALGQKPSILKSGEHDETFYHDMWDDLTHGRTWKGEIVNRSRDGELFTESATISPVHDDNGKISAYIAVLRDITAQVRHEEEKAQLQKQLLQSQKLEMVGRLAGGISHDFNNLLVPILGFAELLLMRIDADEKSRHLVKQIYDAGDRARTLIQQLLAYSRTQQLDRHAIDLNQLIEDFYPLLQRSVREDVAVTLELSDSLPPVIADRGQLEQVVMNLVVNARDAIDDTGVIKIHTRTADLDQADSRRLYGAPPGQYCVVSISDSGCGMSREVMEKIFDPFFTTKQEGRGTGLGLASVYGIVKQHNGYIKVDSQPGKGTTFTCYFPTTCSSAGADDQVQQSQPLESYAGNEYILVVEDDELVRTLAINTLTGLGYQVQAADCGAEALQLSAKTEHAFDLLLTDMVMPNMNGRTVATRITAAHPDCRVIIMSGYSNDDFPTSEELPQLASILKKPFSATELAATIHSTLHPPRNDRRKISA